jgi:hypothetical protein
MIIFNMDILLSPNLEFIHLYLIIITITFSVYLIVLKKRQIVLESELKKIKVLEFLKWIFIILLLVQSIYLIGYPAYQSFY